MEMKSKINDYDLTSAHTPINCNPPKINTQCHTVEAESNDQILVEPLILNLRGKYIEYYNNMRKSEKGDIHESNNFELYYGALEMGNSKEAFFYRLSERREFEINSEFAKRAQIIPLEVGYKIDIIDSDIRFGKCSITDKETLNVEFNKDLVVKDFHGVKKDNEFTLKFKEILKKEQIFSLEVEDEIYSIVFTSKIKLLSVKKSSKEGSSRYSNTRYDQNEKNPIKIFAESENFKLGQLEKRIEDLQTKIKNQKAKRKVLEAREIDYVNILKNLQVTINKLQDNNDNLQVTINKLQDKNDILQEKNNNLIVMIQNQKDEIEEYKKTIKEHEESIAFLNQREKIDNQRNQITNEQNSLNSRVISGGLRKQISEKSSTNNAITKNISASNKNLVTKKTNQNSNKNKKQ